MRLPRLYPHVALLLAAILHAAAAAGDVDYLSFATEDEANTTGIFRRASPAVVYVTNTAQRRSLFSRDIHKIPRGSGHRLRLG